MVISPRARPRLLADLDGAPVLGHVGPNWFASVMGTGIIAVALLGSPVTIPAARPVALAFWMLATLVLVLLVLATVLSHVHHPEAARRHRDHPVMAHFYGAPAMALLTVGAGAMLLGVPAALGIDTVLWTAGTALGLATTFAVPRRVWDHPDATPQAWWLMPVVPPVVSATTGALLAPHVPDGVLRTSFLVLCWSCLAIGVAFTARVLPLIATQLRRAGVAAGVVPALWILLGPLGQSVTAVDHLHAPRGLALVYCVPVWIAAMVLLATLVVVTLRTRPTFALTWWAFTFPLGTVVTGTAALGALTGSHLLEVLSVVLLAGLVAAWGVVFMLTLRGALSGRLLRG